MLNTGLGTAPAPTLPATAVAAAWQRWQRRLPRMLMVLMGVCLGIATLLVTLYGGSFRIKLTYSVCIGLCCTLINDLAWFGQAWVHDLLRRLRRQPPGPGPYLAGWAGTLPAALICLVLGPPLGQGLADAIHGFSSPSIFDLASSTSRITLVISAMATAVLIAVVSAAERLASARAEAEAAQRQAAETQLRLLQSQLEPHMLFNTLANLRVLIGLEPARAQAMLDHLIAFLRATLQASRRGEHPLADEFARLADYLALMAVRMGPRLQVQLDLPAELKSLPVPPLLLQPLVENSIQHGLEPQVEGGQVRVSARREGDVLVLEVLDTGVGRQAASTLAGATPGRPAGGFGLAGVRERLGTLYGERASITLADASPGQGTLATVRLPLNTPVTTPVTTPATTPATGAAPALADPAAQAPSHGTPRTTA